MLEKKYKIASILHAILFIVQLVFFLFSTDLAFIKEAMVNMIGKNAYQVVHEVLTVPSIFVNGGISALLILDVSIFIFLPLLSIVVIADKIKDTFKQINVRTNIKIIVSYIINLVLDPIKDFKHNKNETYLILQKLRN